MEVIYERLAKVFRVLTKAMEDPTPDPKAIQAEFGTTDEPDSYAPPREFGLKERIDLVRCMTENIEAAAEDLRARMFGPQKEKKPNEASD